MSEQHPRFFCRDWIDPQPLRRRRSVWRVIFDVFRGRA